MPNKHSVVFPSVVQPGHLLTAFLEHCEVYYLYNYYILEVSRCSVSKVQYGTGPRQIPFPAALSQT